MSGDRGNECKARRREAVTYGSFNDIGSRTSLIWLDPSSPGREVFCAGRGVGTVEDRLRTTTVSQGATSPGHAASIRFRSSFGSEGVLLEQAKGTGRGDFVTTVDQSDIRGLVTGMRLIRQGLPRSTYERRSLPCGRLKAGPRIPPTVLPSRPVPLARPISIMCSNPQDNNQLASSSSSRAIAHTNPASSRATAVTASAGALPRPISRCSRLWSRF